MLKCAITLSGRTELLIRGLMEARGISEQDAIRVLLGEALEARDIAGKPIPGDPGRLQLTLVDSPPESPAVDSSAPQSTPVDSSPPPPPLAHVAPADTVGGGVDSSSPVVSPSHPEETEKQKEEAAPVRPKAERKRNEFLDAAWAVFDEIEEERPSAGLLLKWLRDHFRNDRSWMLRELRDLSGKGGLCKGESYMAAALRGKAEKTTPPPDPSAPKPLVRRLECEYMNELEEARIRLLRNPEAAEIVEKLNHMAEWPTAYTTEVLEATCAELRRRWPRPLIIPGVTDSKGEPLDGWVRTAEGKFVRRTVGGDPWEGAPCGELPMQRVPAAGGAGAGRAGPPAAP